MKFKNIRLLAVCTLALAGVSCNPDAIEEAVVHDLPEEQQRWYAIKVFERDDKVLEQLNIPKDTKASFIFTLLKAMLNVPRCNISFVNTIKISFKH
jgi:hypothetical protein